jgi:hypothetical protein
MLCSTVASGQWKQQVYFYNKQEAIDLVNQLFRAIHPDKQENQYLPAFVRERVAWIYNEEAAGRLEIRFIDEETEATNRTLLMASGYTSNGKPIIAISLKRLILLFRLQHRVPTGFNRMQQNIFALALTHEAVHLEHPQAFFQVGVTTPQMRLAEEVRAYRKVDDLAVAELIRKNEPVDRDFEFIHKLIVNCGKAKKCPELEEFVNGSSITMK